MSSTKVQAVLALIFLQSVLTADSTKHAMKKTYWEPICKTAKALRAIPQAAYGKLSSLIQEATEAQRLSLQISVYSAAHAEGGSQLECQAASTALQKHAETKQSALATLAKEALQSAATTAELVGEIEGVMSMFKKTTHSTAFCLGNEAATANGAGDYTAAGCGGATPELTGTIPDIAADVIGPNGFANLGQDNSAMGATDSKCPLLDTGSTAGTNVFDHTGNPTLLHGIIKISGANLLARDSQANLGQLQQRGAASLLQLAYHDAKQIKDDPTTAAVTDPIQLLKTIARDGKLKTALETELKALTEESEHDKIPAKANDIINDKYKHDTNKLDELWNNIKTKEVKDVTQTGSKTKQIQQITDLATLQATLNYYINSKDLKITSMKEQINKLKENSGKSVENAGEKICNAIGDATTCNSEKQCSYETETDGTKKCTYNATKAAANGVHATQTQAVGGTEATTDKCTGKPQGECKYPECKWEGTECKNSSFQPNKKLALISSVLMDFLVY
uniref:Variant surface glycoprotein 448 n=1 Tax=Trypanosoma brucei TaxID=5691 RepID=M4T033_9TRYP|nr:variant surface glycoprotein 448 [Trypanosoma brucei]